MSKLHIAEGLSLPLSAATETFAILAKRGAGKTYTAAVLSEEFLKAGQQIVVVDPLGVWWGLRASADGKGEGYPILIFGGEHADVPLEETGGKVAADFIIDTGQSVILDLSLLRKNASVRFMTDFAEQLYHRNRSALHVLIDEADAFAPQRPPKGHERLLGAIEDLVRRGRARGIGLTLITQRSAVLNKNVLTQAEVLIALRTTGPQDVAAVMSWIEHHNEEERADAMLAALPSLPVGDAFIWSPGWLDVFKRVHIRKRETFDSSRTPKAGETTRTPKTLAPVDLAKLSKEMLATVERAKENDPKVLRTRIAELEKAAKVKAAPVVDQSVVAQAVKRAITEYQRANEKRIAEFEREYKAMAQRIERARQALGSSEVQVSGSKVEVRIPDGLLSPTPKEIASVPRSVAPRAPSANGNATLGRGESAILTAIAQYPNGVTREQLSILTGYKRSSRDTYLQRLTAAGYALPNGEGVIATDEGIAALGDDFEPLPTGADLRQYWLDRLGGGEQALFRVLIDAHPSDVDRDTLSERTEYKRSSRDTYLQRLAARKLITSVGRGAVRAADFLFE